LQGKRLAIQAGTTGAQYATENGEGIELVTYEDLGLLLAAVETRQVDAGINDNGVLLDFVQNNEEFEVTTEFDTGEQYGIGVATGNTELLEIVNEVLAEVQESGRYDEIYEEWFGATPTS
jgi:polar amino acid transport system substrate-binding protein